MVIPDSSQEEARQQDATRSHRISKWIVDKMPESIKRYWRKVTYTADPHETEKTSLELGMQLFILGAIYYIETAVFVFLINSILALDFNITIIALLLVFCTITTLLVGLLNLRLANRFWSLRQAGTFGHVMVHGLSLMAIFGGFFILHQYSDILLTSPDRVLSLIVIIARFAIFSAIFGRVSQRVANWFVSEDTAPLDCLPPFIGKETKRFLTWGFWKPVMWALISVVLAIIVSAVIMIISGYDPVMAYSALFDGAMRQFDRVLFFATPLILTGLSVALAFKCGLFNIGAEGQVYMGSMAAAILGYVSVWWMPFPAGIHQIACLAVGALAGFLWGFVPGLLKAYRGAHEVVTTMMLSYTAITFTTWLASEPLKEPGEYQWNAQTTIIDPTAVLDLIFGSDYLHSGFFLSLVAVVVVSFLLNRTVLGYEMRAVGLNEDAAESAGINPKWRMALALALSGALAGLAGASEIQGQYHRFYKEWSPGLGWDGITVAVLGNNNPWGCLLGAIFFGFLRAGGNAMHQAAHVPTEMVAVIQGLVVLFIAAPKLIQWMADHGIDYAVWIRKKPTIAVPSFISMIIGILGTTLTLMFLANMTEDLMFLMIPLWIVTVLSISSALSLLGRQRMGPVLAILTSTMWVAIGFIGRTMNNAQLTTVYLGIGLVWLAISLITIVVMRSTKAAEVQL